MAQEFTDFDGESTQRKTSSPCLDFGVDLQVSLSPRKTTVHYSTTPDLIQLVYYSLLSTSAM